MTTSLHARSLTLLPRIKAHARIYFRYIRCADLREDPIAETIALAWTWILKLEERGKDATQFTSTIAAFAARAVKCGRRLAGMEKAKDVMNHQTQQRHDFAVEQLLDNATLSGNAMTEALADNTVTPLPDAATLRWIFRAGWAHFRIAFAD